MVNLAGEETIPTPELKELENAARSGTLMSMEKDEKADKSEATAQCDRRTNENLHH
ncbi:hypothetical protein L0B53_18520 (plasmid) [Vibrio sp. SS-MA-C1-2]|uniref:hypothetical protein n=1 Tax=Vibrio sp. SS-MA-C1-2 TaxID=2908646 RepID=UPI001F31964B|nr:hypothetical protein [Vibrio sp. SS-MA-C1-2]UJF20319.1 hypothetical protein L0B53_18520 [Vibrio sp. SS-MA-C1-2]